MVSRVENGHLAVLRAGAWRPLFWTGVNLGVTTPGHFPSEFPANKEDYRRWFQQMKDMNTRLVRVYTIMSPVFYEALLEFNASQPVPLWLVQGIWPPEKDLIGPDEKGRDAFIPAITSEFRAEIVDAVRVIHGDIDRSARPGHASGRYRANVSEYLLGWLVGAEWYPYAVKVTNDNHPGMVPFLGSFFQALPASTPFENWLASMLDLVATEEMRYGWQHPVAFVNWPTTDPLAHPSEPISQEDMVSIDPGHIVPTVFWQAGYYAAYHVYPWYPDFQTYDPNYRTYRDALGNLDPYAGYLHELRARHFNIPLVIAEFGVPSSRGLAHRGLLGRDQGMHTEAEQGQIDASMLAAIYGEGYDGGFVFAWLDEWNKVSWNTVEVELPPDRRPFWLNRLTNEQFFGLIATDPGPAGSLIVIDGNTIDWDRARSRMNRSDPAIDMSVSHDEANLYLLLRKRGGAWDFLHDTLNIGFQTLPGGSRTADRAPGIVFTQPIQFLLRLNGATDSNLSVLSSYDYHTWRWGYRERNVGFDPNFVDSSRGMFLRWKQFLSHPLELPLTGQRVPASEFDVGEWRMGITDRDSPNYDNLADWYAKDNVIEIRIPWMMLGFTDPSSSKVWNWPYVAGKIEPVAAPGVSLEVHYSVDRTDIYNNAVPLLYSWRDWQLPEYHERFKVSYEILSEAFRSYDLPIAIANENLVPIVSSLSPASAIVGGPAIALTVTGWNFLTNSIVRWNGNNRSTSFVSGNQLIVSITAEDVASSGTASIVVFNPLPGGGESTSVFFSITEGPESPVITSAGLVNGASFRGPFPAPGSLASLFGSNLAATSAVAEALPLPAMLGDVSVHLNNFTAPLFSVSPQQINFQVPWELLGQTQASLTVTADGRTSRPVTIYFSAFAPGLFSTNSQGVGQGAILINNSWEVAAPIGAFAGRTARPARRGEFVTIFSTGLGTVTNPPASGAAPAAEQLSTTTTSAAVTIGGITARVSFAGLAPGFVGLYQVNVQVPENTPAGSAVPVVLTIGGISSNTVTMAIE